MRENQLTTKLQEALVAANETAVSRKHPYITDVHLMRAVMSDVTGFTQYLFNQLEIRPEAYREALDKKLSEIAEVSGGANLSASRELVRLMNEAAVEAKAAGDDFIGVAALFTALMKTPCEASDIAKNLGMTATLVGKAVKEFK
ncbi:MAG TPA: hypothetical protein DCW60_02290, partial [Sutterella sp.]|nr:hypothetical protein [Sutterella sp.]